MIKIDVAQPQISSNYFEQAQQAVKNFFNKTDPGFLHLVDRQKLWESAQDLGNRIRGEFKQMVVVGIGGSSLGSKAIEEMLGSVGDSHQLFFLENPDPKEFDRLFSKLENLKLTAWVFISKSGSTLETLSLFDFVAQEYKKQHLQFFENTFFISEFVKNPLSDVALKYHRPCLEIPKDVGGRYSVLSPVGMLPAAFLGHPVSEFIKGAQLAVTAENEICQMVAAVLESWKKQKWITLFWFYSSVMKNTGAWLQQLWAESLAKKKDRLGQLAPRVSTPMVAIGPCDQHSLLQQIMEGERDKFVLFFTLKDLGQNKKLQETSFTQHNFWLNHSLGEILEAEMQATAEALTQERIDHLTIQIPDLSPKSIGYFFMYFQIVIGTLGEALNIDAFNQPGVELGKRLAKKNLSSR